MKLRFFTLMGIGLLFSGLSIGAPLLTGLTTFSANATGASSGGQLWNTVGGDGFYNLYVTQPNTSLAGPFLNSGNAASTSISVDLSAPGAYTFYILGEPGTSISHFGLNLFFDGIGATPGITVYRPINGGGSIDTTTAATRSLNGGSTPGAGSLTYTSGDTVVTLTDYSWFTNASTGLPTVDRIQAYASTPNASADFRGLFVLEVVSTAIPEPGTWALLLVGLAGLGFAKNRF